MGSISLPALAIRPPAVDQQQQPDMVSNYARLLAIKQSMQEAPLRQQALQQQVEQGQMQNQQTQREMASQDAIMKSFSGLSPTDPDYFQKGIANAQTTGQVLPQHMQTLQNGLLEQRTKLATLSKTQLESRQALGDSLYTMGTQYLKQPDDQLIQNWPVMRQKIASLEGIDPQAMDQAVPQAFPDAQSLRNWVQSQTTAVGMSAAGARAAAAQQDADIATKKFAIEHGPLSQDQNSQLNQGLAQRYQAINPGKQPPAAFQLPPNATVDDYNRIDKILESTEKAQQTAAQLAATNAARVQAQQFAADARQNREDMQQNQQLNSSFQYSNNYIENQMKPLQQAAQRVARLDEMVKQANPQADALIAPELLTITAGGQGSGLRLNEAEIARAIGGATQWTQLKNSLNKWSLDPNKAIISPVQRQQIQKIVDLVADKSNEQLNIGLKAQQDLINATTTQQHHQILGQFGQQFTQSLTSGSTGNSATQDAPLEIKTRSGNTITIK